METTEKYEEQYTCKTKFTHGKRADKQCTLSHDWQNIEVLHKGKTNVAMKHETGDNEKVCLVHGTVCTERCVICHDKTCKQCHYQTVDNGGVTVCEKCNKQRRATLRQLNGFKDDDDKNDDEQHDGNNDKTNRGQSNNGDSSNNTQNNASSNN